MTFACEDEPLVSAKGHRELQEVLLCLEVEADRASQMLVKSSSAASFCNEDYLSMIPWNLACDLRKEREDVALPFIFTPAQEKHAACLTSYLGF